MDLPLLRARLPDILRRDVPRVEVLCRTARPRDVMGIAAITLITSGDI